MNPSTQRASARLKARGSVKGHVTIFDDREDQPPRLQPSELAPTLPSELRHLRKRKSNEGTAPTTGALCAFEDVKVFHTQGQPNIGDTIPQPTIGKPNLLCHETIPALEDDARVPSGPFRSAKAPRSMRPAVTQSVSRGHFGEAAEVERSLFGSVVAPEVSTDDSTPPAPKNWIRECHREYRQSVYVSLRKAEKFFTVCKPTLEPILPRHRSILIDWMIEVHESFQWQTQTLHIAISIVNRFLSLQSVPRERLQLLGVAALLVAGKHEELTLPELDEFVYVCADTYTLADILRQESKILEVLKYRLCAPTSWEFLAIFADAADTPAFTQLLAEYFLELSMHVEGFRMASSSLVAAAAIDLATRLRSPTSTGVWNDTMVSLFMLSTEQVEYCASVLNCAALRHPPALQACRKKHSVPKYSSVSEELLRMCYPVPPTRS